MQYSQLTLEQRYQIYAMKKAGFKQNLFLFILSYANILFSKFI